MLIYITNVVGTEYLMYFFEEIKSKAQNFLKKKQIKKLANTTHKSINIFYTVFKFRINIIVKAGFNFDTCYSTHVYYFFKFERLS